MLKHDSHFCRIHQRRSRCGISPWLPLTPVGAYPPNQYGVYDMRGNAWEWTHDWFDRGYYQRSRKTDPFGPVKGFIKVVRGSDWRFIGEPCLLDDTMPPPGRETLSSDSESFVNPPI